MGWLPVSDHQGCGRVRFYSRHGAEYTDRLPGMVEAFAKLPAQSAILDGDLCLIDPRLMAQMRTSRPDERQLMFLVFDLLHQDGVDLRGLPLSERKRDLRRLCRKSPVPFMREVQTFPNGNTLLFDHCNKFGFEGVVSKRLASRYSSGPSRNWVKTNCPGWKGINASGIRCSRVRASPSRRKPSRRSRRSVRSSPACSNGCERPGLSAGRAR